MKQKLQRNEKEILKQKQKKKKWWNGKEMKNLWNETEIKKKCEKMNRNNWNSNEMEMIKIYWKKKVKEMLNWKRNEIKNNFLGRKGNEKRWKEMLESERNEGKCWKWNEIEMKKMLKVIM